MKHFVFENKPSAADGLKKRQLRFTVPFTIVLALFLGSLYLHFAWSRYEHIAESEALQLSQSVVALLPTGHITSLVEAPGSREIPEYRLVKEKLIKLVESTNSIYFAYIISQRDGSLSVLVDSNVDYASSYSPLGQLNEDGMNLDYTPFQTGSIVLTNPITNQWGTWIRALTHIKDPATQESIAVLAMSYSASEWRASLWKQMIPDILIVICLVLLGLTLLNLRLKHRMLRKNSELLVLQEALYRNVFEQAPIGIALVDNRKSAIQSEFTSINPMGEAILGRNVDDLKKIAWPELTHEEDLRAEGPLFERFLKGEIDSYSMEKRLIKPDGSIVWVTIKVVGLSGSPFYDSMYLCLLEDISARKQSEEALRESERSKTVFLAHLPGMAYRCRYDRNWTMEFVSEGGAALTGYPPSSFIENSEIAYNEIISEEYRDMLWVDWARTLSRRENYRYEYEIITKLGERKWVLDLGQGVYGADGKAIALEGIVLDISEQKKREHQITYLREHDFLTGLYNRSHIEQEKRRLDQPEYWPLSIVICDIDGLRMINDAYGHAEGDQLISKVAKIIHSRCRKDDVLGRVSGGEFAVLLPRTGSEAANQLARELQDTIVSYSRTGSEPRYGISLSVGHGTRDADTPGMEEAIRTAEDYLRNKKLLNQSSSHSAIVSSIMATLYAKSQETEEHGQRLGRFCQMVGERLCLEQKSLDDLQLLSKLHDIGKIGIDDRILNKPGKLTEEEWAIMRQHPEIGCRIAMSTPQLEHISEYILYHHERWDGNGYPLGLKGDEIPILSRILAIADAYDAMTADRIYRKAMPREAALNEIKKNAGTQFDPDIARSFVALVTEEGDGGPPACPK